MEIKHGKFNKILREWTMKFRKMFRLFTGKLQQRATNSFVNTRIKWPIPYIIFIQKSLHSYNIIIMQHFWSAGTYKQADYSFRQSAGKLLTPDNIGVVGKINLNVKGVLWMHLREKLLGEITLILSHSYYALLRKVASLHYVIQMFKLTFEKWCDTLKSCSQTFFHHWN